MGFSGLDTPCILYILKVTVGHKVTYTNSSGTTKLQRNTKHGTTYYNWADIANHIYNASYMKSQTVQLCQYAVQCLRINFWVIILLGHNIT